MKQSNRYLLIAAIVAIAWTLFIGYLASSVIKTHLAGKESAVAHSYLVPAK